jgi:hypothetical protein
MILLPCPLSAGWELIWQQQLPRESAAGRAIGGFSALLLGGERQAWLLSDAPASFSVELHWQGGVFDPHWRLAEPKPLQGVPDRPLDGEALVRLQGPRGSSLWMASEGRLGGKQPAELLELDSDWRVKAVVPLPQDWQPSEGRGLWPNKGPEALVALPGERLLLAAERPLQQDRADQLRLLLAQLQPQAPGPERLRFLPVGTPLAYTPRGGDPDHWGLTDLLPLPETKAGNLPMLALWRGYAEPNRWWSSLELLPPLPLATTPAPPLQPLAHWDLIATGLSPDNWEAMVPGPVLADGRSTLLLASDDNFNPLQANLLALLAPRRSPGCTGP